MRHILINLLVITAAFTATTSSAQDKYVLVLDEDNTETIEAKETGTISFKDKAFKSGCTFESGIDYLKKSALEQGANLIKITRHKKPDGFNKCHRFDATIYKAENPRIYEKKIEWSPNRKLTWKDFRAEKKPPAYQAIALSYCGFEYSARALTSLYGSSTKYIVECIFYPEKSWVTNDKTQVNEEVLKHEQLHFDICEVYARRLYKELSETKVNAFNMEDANVVFQRVYDEYEKRQVQYDEETYAATTNEVQERWNKEIANELKELEAYANRK